MQRSNKFDVLKVEGERLLISWEGCNPFWVNGKLGNIYKAKDSEGRGENKVRGLLTSMNGEISVCKEKKMSLIVKDEKASAFGKIIEVCDDSFNLDTIHFYPLGITKTKTMKEKKFKCFVDIGGGLFAQAVCE